MFAEGRVTHTDENEVFGQSEPMELTDQVGLHNSTPENCEKLIKTFLKDVLEIDPKGIRFDRAHRLGSRFARKPNPSW